MLVFISRTIDNHSPIRTVVEEYECTIIDQSLIDIEFIDIQAIPMADWHFFYSKNGVDSYIKSGLSRYADGIRYAAIGPGTAKHMVEQGLSCDFIGTGTATTSIQMFLEVCLDSETVLFFRARQSANTFYNLLVPYRQCIDIVGYNNRPISMQFQNIDIGLFTSSLNAQAFLSNNANPKVACIAIGQPTYETLVAEGIEIEKIHIAPTTSDEGLALALKKVILQQS